ncbi:hypothetical protein ACFL6I_22500 [candidate division KSB1 bacterium]
MGIDLPSYLPPFRPSEVSVFGDSDEPSTVDQIVDPTIDLSAWDSKRVISGLDNAEVLFSSGGFSSFGTDFYSQKSKIKEKLDETRKKIRQGDHDAASKLFQEATDLYKPLTGGDVNLKEKTDLQGEILDVYQELITSKELAGNMRGELKKEYEAATKKLKDEHSEEIGKYRTKLHKAEERIRDSRSSYTRLEKNNKAMQNELDGYKAANKDISQRLSQSEEERAGLAAEANELKEGMKYLLERSKPYSESAPKEMPARIENLGQLMPLLNIEKIVHDYQMKKIKQALEE